MFVVVRSIPQLPSCTFIADAGSFVANITELQATKVQAFRIQVVVVRNKECVTFYLSGLENRINGRMDPLR
jgi:hypothetical protein